MQVYYKKAVLNSFKHFTEKNLYMSLFRHKAAGLHKICQIFYSTFSAKHVRVTASVKYYFVCRINLSQQMLPWDLFFAFYFNYSQNKHFSFLNVLGNLAMNELIYC